MSAQDEARQERQYMVNNPFRFRYPPVLVEWFIELADLIRSGSPKAAEEVAPTEQLLKSGERLPEGMARTIVFSTLKDDQLKTGQRICLTWTTDGFQASEMVRGQDSRATALRFSWGETNCGIRRRFIANSSGRMVEMKEMRGTCDLRSFLRSMKPDRLVGAPVTVKDFREFHAVRGEDDLNNILSDILVAKRLSCRLHSRDGAMRIKLSCAPEDNTVIVEDKVTGDAFNYKSVAELVAAVAPELYDKGLRVYGASGPACVV